MLTRRLIPCLDVRFGRVVKPLSASLLLDPSDPVECAQFYQEQGADEIALLDLSASADGRAAAVETVKAVRQALSIPITVGGGVRTWEDAARLLESGADKIATNTAAVKNPNLLTQLAVRFGTQCTVVSIDAAQRGPDEWEVVTRSGTDRSGIDVIEWATEAVNSGAGELLLTSWDRDGTGTGYDLELLETVAEAAQVPVIAAGGAKNARDMYEALYAGASAVLAASVFKTGNKSVSDIKRQLYELGLHVRPVFG